MLAVLATIDAPNSLTAKNDLDKVATGLTFYANDALKQPQGVAHNLDGPLANPQYIVPTQEEIRAGIYKDYDSIDSYAGLFLLASSRYYKITGKLPPKVADAQLVSLQALNRVIKDKAGFCQGEGYNWAFPDGAATNSLPIARASYPMHQLMDAIETYAGLLEAVEVFSRNEKPSQAKQAHDLANGIATGIHLFDAKSSGNFYAYKLDNGNISYVDTNLYPGVLANLFALSYLPSKGISQDSTLWNSLQGKIPYLEADVAKAPHERWLIAATRVAPTETDFWRNKVVSNASNFDSATYIDRMAITILALVGAPAKYPPVKETLSLSINEPSAVKEGSNSSTGVITFAVALSSASTEPVTVSYQTIDGTAKVNSDYREVHGVLTFAPRQTLKNITVPLINDAVEEKDENLKISLSGASGAVIVKALGTGTIVDDDGAVPPSLSINDVTLTEGNTNQINANFTIKLNKVSGNIVTVRVATANGTTLPATAGSDYIALASTTLTFLAGETSKTIAVPVIGDTLDEPNETFRVLLSSAVNATVSDSEGIGTIVDNDATPSLSVNDVKLTEGNNVNVTAAFTVKLSAASGQVVKVNYATADSTAMAGSDYNATSGTLTFNSGETSKVVNVTVRGDLLDELDEQFQFKLATPTNATIADGLGIGTITDDDAAPSVSINNASVKEGNIGATTPALLTFTVKLSAPTSRIVTVKYGSVASTMMPASANIDYEVVPQTSLVFAAGETSKTVSIKVKGDVLDEDDEQVDLKLLGATNAILSPTAATGKGTILDDDATPSLSINDASISEGNSGKKSLTFTVTLSAPSGRTATANFATANVSATAGSDYNGASGAVSFAVGQTTRTISIEIVGDTIFEANEQFKVALSRPVNATLIQSDIFLRQT